MRRLALGVFWLLLGCAGPQSPAPVPLGGGGQLELMPPASFGRVFEAQQKLTLYKNGEPRQMVVLLRIEAKRLSLTGLGPLGAPLISLDWGPEGLIQRSSVPIGIEGRYILADLQLALWPKITGLSGLKLEQGNDFRRLIGPEGMVMEVRYHPDRQAPVRFEIEHYLRDYRLVIEPLD